MKFNNAAYMQDCERKGRREENPDGDVDQSGVCIRWHKEGGGSSREYAKQTENDKTTK